MIYHSPYVNLTELRLRREFSPSEMQRRRELKFIDYVSSLPKDKFIYEDVDVLRLEDLFAKLRSLRTDRATTVLFWEQGVVFAGFADESGTPFGAVFVMNATLLDEGMDLLFKKGGVRFFFGYENVRCFNEIEYKKQQRDEVVVKIDPRLLDCSNDDEFVTTSYHPEVITEDVSILDSPSEYVKKLKERPDYRLEEVRRVIEEIEEED